MYEISIEFSVELMAFTLRCIVLYCIHVLYLHVLMYCVGNAMGFNVGGWLFFDG